MKHVLVGLLFLFAGCGTFQKWGIRSISPVFKKGSDHLTRERSWDFFKESTPANLKFLELLYYEDQNNLTLLSLLVKGFAGYAFAVPETLAFGEELEGIENSTWRQEAILQYTRAFDYGLLYLNKKSISSKELLGVEDHQLEKHLSKELDEDDLSAVLYFAQAWGSLINLQKDNIALVAQVPKVKVLFDWVCGLKRDIDHGVCDIFYAQYEASRPKMLGGNPENAEKLYLAAIKKRPHHLLIRLGYIQYLILPSFDQEKYEKISPELVSEFEKWGSLGRDSLEDSSEYKGDQEINLYNAIAKKRFEMIEKNKKKLF
jgi:hypothetical protein